MTTDKHTGRGIPLGVDERVHPCGEHGGKGSQKIDHQIGIRVDERTVGRSEQHQDRPGESEDRLPLKPERRRTSRKNAVWRMLARLLSDPYCPRAMENRGAPPVPKRLLKAVMMTMIGKHRPYSTQSGGSHARDTGDVDTVHNIIKQSSEAAPPAWAGRPAGYFRLFFHFQNQCVSFYKSPQRKIGKQSSSVEARLSAFSIARFFSLENRRFGNTVFRNTVSETQSSPVKSQYLQMNKEIVCSDIGRFRLYGRDLQ